MKKTNTNEGLEMDMTTYKKVKGTMDPNTPVKITGDKPSITDTSRTTSSGGYPMTEEAPTDAPVVDKIKYLSNLKDAKSGQVSKPFSIADKKYQMVRGIMPNKEIVMGVYCHDDIDESGANVIHPVDYFEESVVKPYMAEQSTSFGNDMEVNEKPKVRKTFENEGDSLNLSEFKHYLVNEKTGKFRKFKSIVELAAAVMGEGEKYMPIKDFKRFFEGKVFGGKRQPEMNLNELDNDVTMAATAKKLMDLISSKVSPNIFSSIRTPIAKREVIIAFSRMIGVTKQELMTIASAMENVSATPTDINFSQSSNTQAVTERKQITKNELIESLSPKVIQTIKVKDIK